MKTTFLKKGLIVGLLLISGAVFAGGTNTNSSEYLDMKVTPMSNKMVRVIFQKLEDEKVKIKIFDSHGVRLHAEQIGDKTVVAKRFDMSQLPDGKYSFEVSNDIFTMKKTVEVKQ